MAGPGTSQELLAEIASRPGRDTVVSFVVKAAPVGPPQSGQAVIAARGPPRAGSGGRR